MSSLLRRRASFADSLALRVAFDCVPAGELMPAVFCSRYGEVHRSVEMLEALTKGEPLSPMTFGFSVHNTASALYSIARGDTSATSSVAAGHDTLPEGLFEACGLLAEGAPRVLLAAYDDGLPEAFGRFAEEGDRPAALGLVLEPAGADGYSLELARCDVPGLPLPEPQVVSVARFLERGDRELTLVSGPRRWIWRRHD